MSELTTTTHLDMDEAEVAIRSALADQGFGILTEIDVAATLKAKLDVDRTPLKILGACNPHLAHQALTLDPDAALVLPCNVALEAKGIGTTITAANPHDIMPNPELRHLADEAAARLRAAIDTIAAQAETAN